MRVKSWAMVACAAAAAGGIASGVLAQPPKYERVKAEAGRSSLTTVEAPQPAAKGGDALITMLSDARSALGKVRDYTCTFTRQEVRNGAISAEEVGEMKVRTSPVGVYVRFARPGDVAGMEVAYSAARKAKKMRYRPASGEASRVVRSIDLDDSKFLAHSRHQVTDWTMLAVLDRVSAAVAREKTLNNPVEVYTADYQFAGQDVTRYEIYTRRPHAFRYAYRMLVHVDKRTNLPVRYEAYTQPKAGAGGGDLLEAYSFSDIKANVGLGENTFDF